MKVQKQLEQRMLMIAWISGGLIAFGYISRFLLNFQAGYFWSLMMASVVSFLPIALHAFQALKVRTVSIELLVSIAILGAFLIREYNESAIVSFLFLFGHLLERKALEKTRRSVKKLTDMAPVHALRIDGPRLQKVAVDEVEKGDRLLVKTGAQVPVDGRIISGFGYLNEASVTGESRAVRKKAGQTVFAGTLLDNGTLHIEAERVGEDTTFGKIIESVEEAQDEKSHVEKFIDRFARGYTPAVLVLALAAGLWTQDLRLAVTLLVLGCPGALVIGAPVSNVAGIGNGARHGVLIKGGEIINQFSRVDTLLLDKTGTLTRGATEVTEVAAYTRNLNNFLTIAQALEKESDHPLGKAIVSYAERRNQVLPLDVRETIVVKGKGIRAKVAGRLYFMGSETFVKEAGIHLREDQQKTIDRMRQSGASTVLMADAEQLVAVFAITDRLRDNVPAALASLRKSGIRRVIMQTGDNRQTAEAIARQAGIDEIRAELLPEEKAADVEKLKKAGHTVAFIGDGINDSPSIAAADIGIAMGNGTDVAVETSDIVLMRSRFSELAHAHALARKTVWNMKENIAIALGTVLLLLIGLLNGWIYMASGMLIHEISILLVIVNAMRLPGFRSEKAEKHLKLDGCQVNQMSGDL
ncbi:heavy metal translocating P-type ATPase [Sporolactobacillus sp. THM7-4]|nr:heavy metal translocating P-type ATPase [Sporolactobacillus sp. THM7-4]